MLIKSVYTNYCGESSAKLYISTRCDVYTEAMQYTITDINSEYV